MNASKKLAHLAAAAVAGLALAGCGAEAPSPGTAGPAPSAPAEAQAGHNDADIAFARGMIVHHRQAIEMAELAATRSGSPQVRDLAARIAAAQGPEVGALNGWLQEWGAQAPAGGGMDHGGMDHGGDMGGGDMGGGMDHGGGMGMMSPEQMQQLSRAEGAAFDEQFLEMMIEHHRGAIGMARTELAEGTDPEARELAQMVTTTQQGEIVEMETLLQQA